MPLFLEISRTKWRQADLSHAGQFLEGFRIKAAVQVFHCQPPQAPHTAYGAPCPIAHGKKVVAMLHMQLCTAGIECWHFMCKYQPYHRVQRLDYIASAALPTALPVCTRRSFAQQNDLSSLGLYVLSGALSNEQDTSWQVYMSRCCCQLLLWKQYCTAHRCTLRLMQHAPHNAQTESACQKQSIVNVSNKKAHLQECGTSCPASCQNVPC